MRVYYGPSYIPDGSDAGVETQRKAQFVARALAGRSAINLVAPEDDGQWPELLRAHDARYVAALQSGSPRGLAETNGLRWTPSVYRSALASTAGVVYAAREALDTKRNTGSLSSGLHHARRTRGGGFCTFNGLAVAALDVAADGGRVLIVDLDAHGGGGTVSMIGQDPRIHHLDISVSPFDRSDEHLSPGDTYDLIGSADAYLLTLERRLDAHARSTVDLVLYNAGVDPHEHDRLGGLTGITDGVLAYRDAMVADWARVRGVPVTFVLAGGYVGVGETMAHLVQRHLQTVDAMTSGQGVPSRAELKGA